MAIKKSISPKAKKKLFRGALIAAGSLLAVIAGFIIWLFVTTDVGIADSMGHLNMKLTSVVYCMDKDTGEWFEYEYLSSEENRIWADIDEIPNYLEDAFIAIEDQRFMSHNGVDWKRTFGAVVGEVFGGSDYGGSTITQQLVKNLTGEKDRSYIRKVKEIIRALSMESKLSKQQILEMYLNSIYLGQGCHGVEAASKTYFNKNVNELTLAESASIAGITQFPAIYDPFINEDKNIEKQRRVLAKMLELGYIGQDEYDEAIAQKLEFEHGEIYSSSSQSYFVDALVEDVIDALCKEYDYSEGIATQMVYGGGLQIYSTMDPDVQTRMEDVFENENNFPGSNRDEKVQGAMVIIEPKTGYIKGVIGGRGEKTMSRGLNRATQTTRQPGSTIKPLSVYGPAVDLGIIGPDSVVEDVPINIGGWNPKNHYGSYYGDMTVRRAVNISANIPAIKVLQKLTVEKSFEYMTQKLGFTTLVKQEERGGTVYSDQGLAPLALGGLTDGVTVLEMCAAYSTFANNGTYIEPTTYVEVKDNEDKTVLKKEQKSHVAFKTSTAYQVNQLLKGVVTSGTGVGAGIGGIETAGKTGTTDRDTDRWFAGYTPYYAGIVWVGYDSSHALPSVSANPALALWKKVMPRIHSDLAGKNFDRPSNMHGEYVCYETGLVATPTCFSDEGTSTAVFRYYEKGAVPTESCPGNHGTPPEEVEGEGTEDEASNGTTDGESATDGASLEGTTSDVESSHNNSSTSNHVADAPPENIIE